MSSWLTWFLSPWGLLALAALDSSPLLFLPFANDFAVVYLAARSPDRFWLYPVLATAGAVIGTAVSYAVGHKIGDEGLERFVQRRRLESLRARARAAGAAVPLALPALFPPPFPFTPFVLAAGAFTVDRSPFFAAVAVIRLVRYLVEAWLAHHYGSAIVRVMESGPFRGVMWGLGVLVIAGTVYSVYRVTRRRPAAARA